MIVLNHGGSFAVPADVDLARERVHPFTMAAEGPLHELGAIGIVNSDSQGMGRIMESVRRTLQLAHVMKSWRSTPAGIGHPGLPGDGRDEFDDTDRVLRSLAKVTIEPAIVHGLVDTVGSLRPGGLADIVLWKPGYFGVKPELVLKSGYPAWAPLGEGTATVERAEPTRYRADWGGSGRVAARLSVTFVSAGAAGTPTVAARLGGSGREIVAVGGTRGLTRADFVRNRATVPIDIDPREGGVSLEGRNLEVRAGEELPLNGRTFRRWNSP